MVAVAVTVAVPPLLLHPVAHPVAVAAEAVDDAHVVWIRTDYVVRWISWRKMPANGQTDVRLAGSRIPIPSPPSTKTADYP